MPNSEYEDEEDFEDCTSTEAYGYSPPEQQRRKRSSRVKTHKSTATSPGHRVRYDHNISGFAAIQSDDLSSEYQSICESLVRQRLPKDLKFSGSTKGIKSQFKDAAKVLISSGKYLETSLKLAFNIQASRDMPGYNPYNDVDDLLVCLITHMKMVQEEHCLLTVGSNYGPRTQQIFRSIHNNPAQFTPSVIEELKCSATLAALPMESGSNPPPRFNRENQFRGNGHFNSFRGRGRGFYHGNFSQQDNNVGFCARQIPSERVSNSQDD